MEWYSSVQDRSRSACNIFVHRYGAPCCANAIGYRILRFPTALRAVLSTPLWGGTQYTKYLPFGGYAYTFYVKYPLFGGYKYTFYATLPRP
eukprot:5868327-Ditylum_brightwellii.AAC.1